MNEYRRQILEMLAASKITAEEAERLIAAVEKETPSATSSGPEPPKTKAKYLRVLVDSENAGDSHGPVKVNIRVPMQLLRAGVKLAGLIPPQARDHVNEALREKGIPFDIGEIKPDNLTELVDHLNDLTIDVDTNDNSEKVKVRVFCE